LNDPQPNSGPQHIRFDGFEADVRSEELSRAGRRLRLPHQSFRVLAMLLEKAGQLVTREELRARLWPAGTLVEYDQRLNAAVNRLREALGDSAEAPRFIETLPKRGYRFIAAVEPPALPTPPLTPDRSSQPSQSRRKVLFAAAAGLSAMLIAITILMTAHRSPTRAPFGRQVVPFTSLPGKEIAPTFSPDGSQIAFGWNEGTDAGHQFDLYVKSLGSERLLRLTHHPSRWISPAWSPDGSTIAFVRQTGQHAGIFVIPALGGSERSIVSGELTVGSIIQISWSPDGRRLAYSAYGAAGAPRVFIVSLQALNTRPLSPAPECLAAVEPAFSPDGKQLALACISSSAVYTIYVVGLPDGPVRPLASVLGEPQGLTWAADGSRLIFSNDPGDGGELWQLTLNGRLEQFPFGEDGSVPAVAARGGRMAYVRSRKTVDIWRADLTAVHPEESAVKLIYSTRTQMIPRYSHDGGRIAFLSNRSGRLEIWMTDAQGADPDRLTSFDGPFTSAPSWCSDGRRIAFDSRVSGIPAIYIEDINERVPRKLITSPANLSLPVWSEDCRWLFASDGHDVLYRVPSSGGEAERFTEHPSHYDVVVADRVIFNVLEANGVVLWTKPAGGGPQAPLEALPKLSYDDAWAATTAGIYYTDSSSRPISVNFYEFASRTTRRLMTLRQAPIPGGGPGIAVSPDGRWLLYSQSGDEQSEVMLATGW
jgi:Tol biopolymer transport system component/DNA-binding winged helix-turn-helix (wHTH) protein